MATKNELMQRIIRMYREQTGEKDVDMHKVSRFAVTKKLMKLPTPRDPFDMLAKDFSVAAREEVRYDQTTQQPYRVNHCYAVMQDGKQLHLWLDIDDKAPRYKMVKALNSRREQSVGDLLQMTLDADHWSAINMDLEPIKVDLDFTDEIEWRKNAPGEDKKAS